MAIEFTTISPEPRPFAFTGFDETVTRGADVARAEIVYTGNATIPVPAVGDTQALVLDIKLPKSFCYVLLDVSLLIQTQSVSIDDWPDSGTYTQRPGGEPVTDFKFSGGLEASGNTIISDTSSQKSWRLPNKPSYVLIPSVGLDGVVSIRITTKAIDLPQASFDFYVRFLQYDINQAHHWAVNSPAYVRP